MTILTRCWDRPTDRQTDRPTDIAIYGAAIAANKLSFGQPSRPIV